MRMTRFLLAALCCVLLFCAAITGNSISVAAQVGTQAPTRAATSEPTVAATSIATRAATQALTQPTTQVATEVVTEAATLISTQAAVPPACMALPIELLDTAKDVCAKSEINTACLVNSGVQIKMADSTAPTFEKAGDQLGLEKLGAVNSTVTDPQNGGSGIVMFKLQGGLPAISAGVTAVLYGGAVMKADVVGSAEAKTIPATNAGTDPIILRSGAGKGYAPLGQLKPGQNVVADGRNTAGDWVRVRLDSSVAWAFASLLQIGGNIQSLPELDEQNTRPDFLYVTPMQSFSLTTGTSPDAACGPVPSGLLLQSAGEEPARFLIDDTDLRLEAATVVIRAELQDHLDIALLSGKATVTAFGGSIDLTPGQWARIRIGGGDGLTPLAPPSQPSAYAFAMVDGAPLSLLTSSITCTVGLPATSIKATVRVGPGAERGSLFFITPDQNYPVIGQGKDAAGNLWWKINALGRKEAWVSQAEVHSIGVCGDVADAAAPVVVVAGPSDTGNDVGVSTVGTPVSAGFAPTAARTIWQAEPGPISTTGACVGVPVAYCSQLVALVPKGTGYLWRGQELQPYFMFRVKENIYAYAGPNVIGDAQLKLTLTFTSPTTFKATQVMVMNNQKGCTNTFTFSGTFLR